MRASLLSADLLEASRGTSSRVFFELRQWLDVVMASSSSETDPIPRSTEAEESSSSDGLPSLLNYLRAPRPSLLARARKVKCNSMPPPTEKKR